MSVKTAVVVTSIAAPNRVLRELADRCCERGHPFYVIGDVPSPADFFQEGCEFFSLERQLQTSFRTAPLCPQRHYARKNIGYLLAMQAGAQVILETDDDNFPREGFWDERRRIQPVHVLRGAGWVNVYRYFGDGILWPRGFPLDSIHRPVPEFEAAPVAEVDCPIQQGLADGNPDVDVIYRLVFPLPVSFRRDRRLGLGPGSWCPFNSQNTAWWPDAYPLLYLPAYCSFRMTDIWRSFVAQRIAWSNNWHLLFEGPTVFQERNDHDLIRDFQDEVPGYLNNRRICEALEALPIRPGKENLGDNLRVCHEALVRLSLVGARELQLVEAWLEDVRELAGR